MKQKRLEYISEKVREEGSVNVIDLSQDLAVAPKTIRLDLDVLQRANVLQRVHGGAVPVEYSLNSSGNSSYRDRFNPAKIEIAKEAFKMIQENDVILLDDGSSTYELAKLLGGFRVTVLTNDMLIVQHLLHKPLITLFVIGGFLRRDGDAFIVSGEDTIQFVRRYQVNKLFLGTSTIDSEKGLMIFYYGDRATKRAFISTAEQVVCLADSSKFGKAAFSKFADIHEIDTVITDSKVNKELLDAYRRAGVNVRIAERIL